MHYLIWWLGGTRESFLRVSVGLCQIRRFDNYQEGISKKVNIMQKKSWSKINNIWRSKPGKLIGLGRLIRRKPFGFRKIKYIKNTYLRIPRFLWILIEILMFCYLQTLNLGWNVYWHNISGDRRLRMSRVLEEKELFDDILYRPTILDHFLMMAFALSHIFGSNQLRKGNKYLLGPSLPISFKAFFFFS